MFDPNNSDKTQIPFVQTQNHNSSIDESNLTIQELTEQFTQLQRDNHNLVTNRQGIQSLFRSKEEKLQQQQNLEKMCAYHDYEMSIGSAICEAKKKDIQMQIAAGLAQKKVILDTQTKAKIGEIYHQFSQQMSDRLTDAVKLYLDGIKQAEAIPHPPAREKVLDYTQRKFQQDCQLIEDLANKVLQNIYADLKTK